MTHFHLVSNADWYEALYCEDKTIELRPFLWPMTTMAVDDVLTLRYHGHKARCKITFIRHYKTYEGALRAEKLEACTPSDAKMKRWKYDQKLAAAIEAHTRSPYRGATDEAHGIVAIGLFLTHFADEPYGMLHRVLDDDEPEHVTLNAEQLKLARSYGRRDKVDAN